MEAFESGMLDLPDFYFTGDDYRYRFEPEAKQRFLELLRERFNSGVTYKGRAFKWDTVVEQKTTELGRYFLGRTAEPDFLEPSPNLHRTDDRDLRGRILGLTHREARRLGIGKSTLHYLRKNADGHRSFKLYERVRRKLEASRSVPVE
jgi:GNAT superfamily N-acetyltransferase